MEQHYRFLNGHLDLAIETVELLRYYCRTLGLASKCPSQFEVFMCIYGYDKGKLSSEQFTQNCALSSLP